MTMTPSSYVQVANAGALEGASLPHLTHVVMSGEAIPWKQTCQWMEAAPQAVFYSFYGSTEMLSVAIDSIGGSNDGFAEGEAIPAGKPYPSVDVLLLDEDGREVPLGEPGEVYAASPWVSTGYYRDAERTAASFVVDPQGLGYQTRYFRSGDMGRFGADGKLTVLGRKDAQIKRAGYRMELGEVETALRAIPGWLDGCCLYDAPTARLCCFWTGGLSQRDLTKALKEKLPKYMLPDAYMHMDRLPLTATTKLDRAALREMMKMMNDE